DLETQLSDPPPGTRDHLTQELQRAREGLRETEITFYQTPAGRETRRGEVEHLGSQLKRASFELNNAERYGANRREVSELNEQVRHRLHILETLRARLDRNQPLPEREVNSLLNVD